MNRILLRAKYRKPILLGLSLLFFNCMTGINAVLYYLNVFEALGNMNHPVIGLI
jgi:hypothetical protein